MPLRNYRPLAILLTVAAFLVQDAGTARTSTSAAAAPGDPDIVARTKASQQARATGRRTPVDELTSESRRVWALPDGRYEAEISTGIARIRRAGGWVDVDLTLQKRADGFVAPRMHPADLVLSGAGQRQLTAMGPPGERIGMTWSGRLPEPALAGATARYPEVYPGIDLDVEVRRKGYEQTFVVKNRAALAHVPAALASLRLSGSHPRPDGTGGLEYTDRTGRVIGNTRTPVMWDAATDRRTTRQVDLKATGAGYVLSADNRWLGDPARRFPITIDPVDEQRLAGFDTWVNSSYPGSRYDTDTQLEIGTRNSGGTKRIAYVNLDAQGMAGAIVHSANLKIWGSYAAGGCGDGTWQVFGTQTNAYTYTTWNGRPNLVDGSRNVIGKDGNGNPFGGSLAPSSGGCTGQWLNSDARRLFQYAADSGFSEFTAALVPYWDDTNIYYKRFKSQDSTTLPHVILSYSWPPSLSSRTTTPGIDCIEGAGRPVMPTDRPRLSATYAQHENHASDVTFEWQRLDGTPIRSATIRAAAGSTASADVPAGDFTDGGNYRWRVGATTVRGDWSNWSSWCEFTVDAPPPPVPGCQSGTSSGADFNGDGTRDSVITDPMVAVNGFWEAGVVHILDGRTGASTTLHQDLAEVPGTAANGDRFGDSIAVFDANQDGCADLAVGTPRENLGPAVDAGTVSLLYGTPSGLGKGPAAETYVQGVDRVPGIQSGYDYFGYSLAAGQTAAGEPFLIIGAPGDDPRGIVDAGTVTYLRGHHRLLFDQTSTGDIGGAERDDRGGTAVAASRNHFAVGYPGENEFAGRVCVFSHEPVLVGCVSQGASTVEEPGDSFGKSISMAPYRNGTDSILVVGVPGEDIDAVPDAGLVEQFQVTGSAITGLATNTQNDKEAGDLYGEKVQVVNTDGQTLLVAIGAPGEDTSGAVDAGVVWVFAAGTASPPSHITLDRMSGTIPGAPGARELIGISLGGSATEVIVASPYLGQKAVYTYLWADLAAGRTTMARQWSPSGSVSAFGVQVG